MKINKTAIIFLSCVCFLLSASSVVTAQNLEFRFDQLSMELQQAGVFSRGETNALRLTLKNMLGKGVSNSEIKGFAIELFSYGIKGGDLRRSIQSMADLVDRKEDFKENGSSVAQAVARAHARGLKGKDIAAAAHEAIKHRKAQKDEEKRKAKKSKKHKQQDR